MGVADRYRLGFGKRRHSRIIRGYAAFGSGSMPSIMVRDSTP